MKKVIIDSVNYQYGDILGNVRFRLRFEEGDTRKETDNYVFQTEEQLSGFVGIFKNNTALFECSVSTWNTADINEAIEKVTSCDSGEFVKELTNSEYISLKKYFKNEDDCVKIVYEYKIPNEVPRCLFRV